MTKNQIQKADEEEIGEHNRPERQPKIEISEKFEPEILNLSFHDY